MDDVLARSRKFQRKVQWGLPDCLCRSETFKIVCPCGYPKLQMLDEMSCGVCETDTSKEYPSRVHGVFRTGLLKSKSFTLCACTVLRKLQPIMRCSVECARRMIQEIFGTLTWSPGVVVDSFDGHENNKHVLACFAKDARYAMCSLFRNNICGHRVLRPRLLTLHFCFTILPSSALWKGKGMTLLIHGCCLGGPPYEPIYYNIPNAVGN